MGLERIGGKIIYSRCLLESAVTKFKEGLPFLFPSMQCSSTMEDPYILVTLQETLLLNLINVIRMYQLF